MPPKVQRSANAKPARGMRKRASKNIKSDLLLRPTTKNWNVNSQSIPAFNDVIAKDNKIYRFVQSSNQGNICTSSSSVASFFAKGWTTSDIVQFSSFAAVFDQYRVDRIEAWLMPFGVGTVPGYNSLGKMYTVVDYDDAVTPTSIAALQQYENCVTTRFTDGHYVNFVPHIAVAAYGGAFTQFLNEKATWIDCGSTGTFHYGLKLGIENTVSGSDVKIDMFTRIHVSFRNVF
jgi:hypothetical protein